MFFLFVCWCRLVSLQPHHACLFVNNFGSIPIIAPVIPPSHFISPPSSHPHVCAEWDFVASSFSSTKPCCHRSSLLHPPLTKELFNRRPHRPQPVTPSPPYSLITLSHSYCFFLCSSCPILHSLVLPPPLPPPLPPAPPYMIYSAVIPRAHWSAWREPPHTMSHHHHFNQVAMKRIHHREVS